MSMPLSLARRIRSGRVTLDDLREEAERTLGARKSKRQRTAPKRAAREADELRARKTKAERRREIREAIVARSGGRCERIRGEPGHPGGVCGMPGVEMDHFWGRAREESVESCWLHCVLCARAKTENRPSRRYWLWNFAMHAQTYGYGAQIDKARNALSLEQAQHPSPSPASPQETP